MAGLEPARLAPLPPQDSVSTNSTTSARLQRSVANNAYSGRSSDPAGAVGAACARLGVELDPSTPGAIADYVEAKPRGRHGRHDYSLEAFGLDADEERERFRAYTDRFRLLE